MVADSHGHLNDRAREAASGARASSVPATLSAGGFALLLKFYTTPGGSPVPGPDGFRGPSSAVTLLLTGRGLGKNHAITFAIARDGRVAGGCGLHRRGGPSTLEIGCWTHPAFLRLGVARTAARLLTGLAFTVPGIERVEIRHDKASQAGAGVPRSSGCRPIGEQPGTPSAPAGHGIDCTWRITWDEWLNAR